MSWSSGIDLADDITLEKVGARLWRVRYICAYSKRWIWSEEFTAHTKAVAVRKARPLVVALINASAARWEAAEAEASDEKLAARLRSIRIDTSEGWK